MIELGLPRLGVALAAPAALIACGLSGEPDRGETHSPRPEPLPAAVARTPPRHGLPASIEGLRLHGVLTDGAVIAGPEGGQRLVVVGREVAPGLILREVGLHRIVLAWSDGTAELGFEHGSTEGSADAPPAAASGERPEAAVDVRRDEILRYRLGFAPRRNRGRTTGFTIRQEADLPALRRAGLRAGDVLVAVNGQSFDSEERVEALPSEIAGSFTAEFVFERDGRRLRARLPVNPRP